MSADRNIVTYSEYLFVAEYTHPPKEWKDGWVGIEPPNLKYPDLRF